MLHSDPPEIRPDDSIAELIRSARAGSQESLGRLLQNYRGYLLAIAHASLDADLKPKGGPSDLVQETFLEAQRDFEAFYGEDRDALARWLRGLLRNNVTDFVRRHRLAERRSIGRENQFVGDQLEAWQEGLPSNASTPSARAAANEEEERLLAAIAGLPSDYRKVIHLRHVATQPWSKVAMEMGRSEDAVQKLWTRALGLLRDQLSRD